MSFREYLELLQRRWRIVVSMLMIGLLVAVAFNVLARKSYTAAATSFVTVSDADAAASGELFQGSQFAVQRMASYAALSSSPEVLDGVIDELALDISPRALRKMVTVSSPATSVLLEVSVEDADPRQAANIADEVSRQLGMLIERLETPRGLAASSVKVTLTRPADVPVAPSSPRVTLNLLLGMAGGAAAGLLLALLRHHLDRRLRTVADVRAITEVAPLGSTIHSRAAEREPLVATELGSVEAERYRSIRASLKLADAGRESHQLVISSPAAGDGRTSVAANLALSWAVAGATVCLVDADLRSPTASRVFGLESADGLTDVVAGDAELDTVLRSWNGGALTILPAGSLPPDPVELLGSKAMGHLIAELGARFDVVIYDSEPMLAVGDAAVLARAVGGLVLVVRSGATTAAQLSACLEKVRGARLPLLGTALVGVKERRRARRRHRVVDDGRRVVEPRDAAPSRRHRVPPPTGRATTAEVLRSLGARSGDDAVGEHRHREEDDEGRRGVEHAALQHAHQRDEQGEASDERSLWPGEPQRTDKGGEHEQQQDHAADVPSLDQR
ncbi:polysaccharide biosynthesis tyrosine autokinase [Georgenia ruanii]|uniref:polysaccharide biosynthesis tyrosine autokinase n=1 Tax=Georgenia ruanii TaxID=348442 RepID=UPI00186AFEB3|nr:polysaccharide biosynthesis tyrosine autokinase [Georgenia ruanii]